jgi:hypothetical protein
MLISNLILIMITCKINRVFVIQNNTVIKLKNATATVIAMTFAFLFMTAPASFTGAYYYYYPIFSSATGLLILYVCQGLLYIYKCSSFLLVIGVNKKFRDEIKSLSVFSKVNFYLFDFLYYRY